MVKEKAVVIIPTYNERENIGRMIEVLEKEIFPQIKDWEMAILVVDDHSPDGTAEIVREKMKDYTNIELSLGEKQGLGAAYARGMKYAMEKMNADWVIEFDADFQHDPAYIPQLLNAAKEGYDYVVGSRYVPGGKVPQDWNFSRRLISSLGSFVARFILFFPFEFKNAPRDLTSGLKATKVKGFLEKIDLDHLLSKGYAYKIEIFYRMVKLGAKVKEIPIEFKNREKGESKMPPKNLTDSLKVVIKLRLQDEKTQSFLKFAVVGFVGYLVNALSLALFTSFSWPEVLCWLLSTELAIISNFTWNNLWTFAKEKFTKPSLVLKKFLQFNLTSAGALVIQTVMGTLLTSLFGPEHRQLYLPLIIVFMVLPYNWLMYNKVIWKVGKKDKKGKNE